MSSNEYSFIYEYTELLGRLIDGDISGQDKDVQ